MICLRSFSWHAVFMGFKPIWKNFQIHPCSYTCAEFLTFLPYSFPSCHLEELGENGTQDGNTESGEREEEAVWERGTTDLYVAGQGTGCGATQPWAAKPGDHWEC